MILALHGFNDYSNAFDAPAKLWAKQGIATYAYDQRGFGGAPGRGLWPGSEALATDAVTAGDLAARQIPAPADLSARRKHGRRGGDPRR